jgi:cell division protein FtsB
MSPVIAHAVRRHKGLLLGMAMVSTVGWAVYNGSIGARDLLEKREEIRELQEQNAALQSENDKRRERIERLKSDSGEQDLEIRKLNLLKPGEKTFMLPDAPEPAAPSSEPTR